MIRLSSLVWLVLVGLAGFAMFKVKYEVMGLEERLTAVDRAILADGDAIHVLNAEWSYLSQPARLDRLNRRYLGLQPIATRQLGRIADLPMRPDATPPAAASGALPGGPAPTRLANAKTGTTP